MDTSMNTVKPIYGNNPDDRVADTYDPYPSKDRGYYFSPQKYI